MSTKRAHQAKPVCESLGALTTFHVLVYWGNIGIMEKKMETTIICGLYRGYDDSTTPTPQLCQALT